MEPSRTAHTWTRAGACLLIRGEERIAHYRRSDGGFGNHCDLSAGRTHGDVFRFAETNAGAAGDRIVPSSRSGDGRREGKNSAVSRSSNGAGGENTCSLAARISGAGRNRQGSLHGCPARDAWSGGAVRYGESGEAAGGGPDLRRT